VKVLQNKADFVDFLEELISVKLLYNYGMLFGPYIVPGGVRVPSAIPLYIGFISAPII
jgi:hypothetical protein